MCKKRLLGSFNTAALHRLVRDFIEKKHSIMGYIKYGGGGGYWAETTHQIRPKRPTLKSGRNNPGRNDPAETTHGRNDSCPKRPTAETTRNRLFRYRKWLYLPFPLIAGSLSIVKDGDQIDVNLQRKFCWIRYLKRSNNCYQNIAVILEPYQ